ncbi:MAG: hypothetical protein KatS3mg031_0996 [Chitinophagales bacterium]|nr:MAG: hypothetical protein KatS3mg031_0996 [Chitinophagales bacterium]
MKKIFTTGAVLMAVLYLSKTAEAQTYNDGPMELQIRVTEVRVDYHPDDNVSNDFNLSGSIGSVIGNFINVPSLETDEIRCKVWARDNVTPTWATIGGQCLKSNLPMSSGGPETFIVNPPALIFNTSYPGASVPAFFDLRVEAWEDDKPADFDQLPSGVPFVLSNDCQTADGWSECTYDGASTNCVTLFGAGVLPMEDDIYCNANPFQTNIDYRAAGPPCRWNNHGFIAGNCPSNNYYQIRVESYYRFTAGSACSNPINLGTFTPGQTISHFNSNECYSNNYAGSPGNDVFYKFSITNPVGVDISVCGTGTTYNTVLYLLDNNCNPYASNDDGCGTQSIISTSLCRTGDYYIVVDAKNASDIGQFTLQIKENASFTFAASIVKTDPSCNGAADGSAKVNITGGLPPISILWSNNYTDTLNTGLQAGTYTVTVTDSAQCSVTATTTLIDPAPVVVNVSTTDLTCSGANDGTATANVSGGTSPYFYAWSNGQGGQTAINLGAGTYNVTVTDFKGCTATPSSPAVVNANNPIVIDTANFQHVSCNGFNDGTITVSVSGGVPPYSYQWSNGASGPTVSNLPPGPISLTVFDNTSGGGQCFETASFIITEPAPLVSVINATRNVTCNGSSDGAVDLGVTGGTPPYTYAWSDNSTGEDRINATAGPFSVTVTDNNGCSTVNSGTLTEPAAITSTVQTTDAGCKGDNTGSADLQVSGGAPPYTYQWSNLANTEDLTNVAGGTYLVVVTDANGCTHVSTVVINEYPELAVQAIVSPSCNDRVNGKIILNPNGTPPYVFAWSDGATTQERTDIAAGNYDVTITDANGCTETLSLSVGVNTDCGTGTFDVVIPNAFSPNGDGVNDNFEIIRSDDVLSVHVKIYDRWGSKIYENPNQLSGPGYGWDGTIQGKKALPGVYVYVMDVVYEDPTSNPDRPTQFTGTVAVVR